MKLIIATLGSLAFGSAFLPHQNDELTKSIERGKMVYSDNCISCHLGTGEGVPAAFPPLAKSDYLLKTPEKAIYAIKFGLMGKIKVNGTDYDNMMPPPGLEDEEVADVMNYIRNTWGNKDTTLVTAKMVEAIEEK